MAEWTCRLAVSEMQIAVENGFFVLRLLCNRRETAAGEAFWSPWLDPIDNACVMQIIEGSQP
jgi:hypothetical protein